VRELLNRPAEAYPGLRPQLARRLCRGSTARDLPRDGWQEPLRKESEV